MGVEIAEGVWVACRPMDDDAERAVRLFLAAPDPDATDVAMAAAVEALCDEVEEVGTWTWTRCAAGLVILFEDSLDYRWELPLMARALADQGIDGRLEVAGERPATPPYNADLLELRVRVTGRRVASAGGQPDGAGPRGYNWDVDPEALRGVLSAWKPWIGSGERVFWGSGNPAVAVGPGEAIGPRLLQAAADGSHPHIAQLENGGFRMLQVFGAGVVALRCSGPALAGDGWRQVVTEFTALLREQAGVLVYGYVRRGWVALPVGVICELERDWPARGISRPKGRWRTPEAFEDVFAPDAFGVQWFGSGYSDRLPTGRDWSVEPVADGALVQHCRPAEWFAAPFGRVPEGLGRGEPFAPPLLAAARKELAPLLYRPGVLAERGLVDRNPDL